MCPTSCRVRVCLPIFRVSGVLYRVILLQMPGPTHMSCQVRVHMASHWGAKELYRRLCRRCMSPACARCLSALEVATSASAPYTCCTPGMRAGCMLQPPLCMHLEPWHRRKLHSWLHKLSTDLSADQHCPCHAPCLVATSCLFRTAFCEDTCGMVQGRTAAAPM